MFDFLNSISGSDIGNGLGAAGAILGLFQKQNPPAGYNEALTAARRSSQLADSLDPSSPYFQRLQGQEESRLAADRANYLRELITANRRAVARNGMGLFVNPERRDEMISKTSLTGFEQAQQQARDNARQYIMSQLQANNAAAGAYSPLLLTGLVNQNANRQNRASGMQALQKAGEALFGNTQPKTTQPPMLSASPFDNSQVSTIINTPWFNNPTTSF